LRAGGISAFALNNESVVNSTSRDERRRAGIAARSQKRRGKTGLGKPETDVGILLTGMDRDGADEILALDKIAPRLTNMFLQTIKT
jgi:signal recognition particle GTPase